MQSFDVYGIELKELEPSVVLVDYGTAIVTAERVQDVLDKAEEAWGARRVVVLTRAASVVDLARVASVVEDEALAHFTVASAIVSASKVGHLLANLFMKLQRSPYPQRYFTNEQKALDWLRMHLANDQKQNCRDLAS